MVLQYLWQKQEREEVVQEVVQEEVVQEEVQEVVVGATQALQICLTGEDRAIQGEAFLQQILLQTIVQEEVPMRLVNF